MIRAENLSFSYSGSGKKIEALKGLGFSIQKGHITGLLGPNGSGKSTTFKILSTQLTPSSGEAWVGGYSVLHQRAQVRQSMGVTFQSPSLDPLLTVEENLNIQATLYGLNGEDSRRRIDELINEFSLNEKRHEYVKHLSGGLARRAELAKTLLANPQLLLLDEPTTGLDPVARADFWKSLRALKQKGLSVFITTHLMEEAEECDELLILSDGKLLAQASPYQLKSEFGFQVLNIKCVDVQQIQQRLHSKLSSEDRMSVLQDNLRIETKDLNRVFQMVSPEMGQGILQIQMGPPTLADVYFHKAGRSLQ